jgi:hypothetical protein
MRQNFLRYLVLRANLDRDSIYVFSEVLALLANLLLFFIVIWCNLIYVFLAIYILILVNDFICIFRHIIVFIDFGHR